MVLIRTESNRYTTNGSFGEIINKFQDSNQMKNTPPNKKNNKIRELLKVKKKKKPFKITRIPFYSTKPVYIYIYIYIYIYNFVLLARISITLSLSRHEPDGT